MGAVLLLLASCQGPIVARSPEARYVLAQEQILNANYSPALDTLAKVVRDSPESAWAPPARVLRIALLGGMARGYRQIAESYLAGHKQAGEAGYAPRMRSVGMDYFGRARGRSLELVEAMDQMAAEGFSHPVEINFAVPKGTADAGPVLDQIRGGTWVKDEELMRAERAAVRRGLVVMLARLASAADDLEQAARLRGPNWRIEPARFYLGVAQEMVDISSIYAPEALGDRRLFRLYHERAARLAGQAARLAEAQGNDGLRERSERLRRQCQVVVRTL